MKRQAMAAMLALANETDDMELRYQCLMSVMTYGERLPGADGVPGAEDAEAA